MVDSLTRAGKPLVTVATVVFNGAREIRHTLESVLGQDYPHIETVVIDGASTDATADIVAGYGDAIDVFISEPDRGIYDGMNKAIAVSTGDLILFMNSGDAFASSNALSALVQRAGDHERVMVFGAWLRRTHDGQVHECRPLLSKGIFNHQSILYSRSLHATHGQYVSVPGLTTADYLFFRTLICEGQTRWEVLEKPVAVIDVGGVSAGPQTLSQKLAVDFLCGCTTRSRLASVLMLHPLYRRLKSIFMRPR